MGWRRSPQGEGCARGFCGRHGTIAPPRKTPADAALRQATNSERTLIQSQRAWVGPRNAAFTAEPSVGKPIELTIEYVNSGREPATAVVSSADAFAVSEDDNSNGTLGARIEEYLNACRNTNKWQGGSVVYPTTSGFGGGYTLSSKTNDNLVDEAVGKGEKVVIVHGCFLYLTIDPPKHTYFCYFYKQGVTKLQNLSICMAGHYADQERC
jgi:hypothetical protein